MFHKNMYTESLKTLLNPVLHTDSYKLSHKVMEPKGTEYIYANFTPRFNHYFRDSYPDHDGKVVVAGTQLFVLKELVHAWSVGFFQRDREEVLAEIRQYLYPYLGMDHPQLKHFGELHDLGYLPLRIKALREGTVVNIQTPTLTVINTDERFSWLTNYIESVLSAEIWKPMTIATAAREFARVRNKWFDLTVSDHGFKNYAVHDFSYRGHSTHESSAACGTSALIFSNGTDNVPAVVQSRLLYLAGEDVAGSVPASEHSVTTLGINHYASLELEGELKLMAGQLKAHLIAIDAEDEYEKAVGELITLYRLATEVFPSGIFSYVSDSYDYWRLITVILPILKPVLLRRDGKLVVRPDSGDPVDIVVGESRNTTVVKTEYELRSIFDNGNEDVTFEFEGKLYTLGDYYLEELNDFGREGTGNMTSLASIESLVESGYLEETVISTDSSAWKGSIQCLWEIFGGHINDKGYKELDPHIGLIYGDGITYDRAEGIYSGLAAKGFAANNVVLGVGSYSFAGGTRDSLGFAIKATYAQVDGASVPIYKEPKTDRAKKSARGLLRIVEGPSGMPVLESDVTPELEQTGLLEVIFENGEIFNFQNFQEIRKSAGWI